MVLLSVKAPDWLLNSQAASILECSKNPDDWVYHGHYKDELRPLPCQHDTIMVPVAAFEVKNQGRWMAGIGKCGLCKKVHWLLKEENQGKIPG